MSKSYDPTISDIKNITIGDMRIDATDPNNLSKKVLPEQETRRRLLRDAKKIGCEKEMFLIFTKYDNLLRNCTNEKERKDIAKLGIFEMYTLLGRGGELYVDGQLVYKETND